MNEDDEKQVKNTLQRALDRLMLMTIAVALALVMLTVYVYVDSHNRRKDIERTANSTAIALCALRADLERRVDTAREFLRDNPKGIPGISRQDIQMSIENQDRTITALGALVCPVEKAS